MRRDPGGRPPPLFWLLPAAVAALRSLPYLASHGVEAPPGLAVLRVGYLPKDFFAYTAFIRQAAEEGSFLLYNPFTTGEGGGRFVLLLHWLLGMAARVTGLEPMTVLELSRVPLVFLFFATLWWFLRSVLPAARERLWACSLVAFSGGLEGWARLSSGRLPETVADPLLAATWPLNGWNTFSSMFNPLWIAGLTLTLVALRPAIEQEERGGWRGPLRTAVAFLLAWLVHPYSAIVILAVVALLPLARGAFRAGSLRSAEGRERQAAVVRELAAGGWPRHALFLAAALLAVLLLVRWQSGDPGYLAASRGFWGPAGMSIFWYPLTLGVLGVLAAIGLRDWLAAGHPWRAGLVGWLVAVALLHTSPVINGYHFVFHLHLPLCALAAAPAAALWESARRPGAVRRLAAALALAALFATPLLVTAESLGDLRESNLVPASYPRVIEALAAEPPGNVLAPPVLGNLLPTYTPHRVWVGHWFLTPDYGGRSRLVDGLERGGSPPWPLAALLEQERIRYLALPAPAIDSLSVEARLGGESRTSLGGLDLLILKAPGSESAGGDG